MLRKTGSRRELHDPAGLDYIDELGDQISEMEAERELLQDEISDIKDQVSMYYRPASPYEITGLRESDFH